jgi:protein-S-isoprenylcysteine O-methyltransferase Ste14
MGRLYAYIRHPQYLGLAVLGFGTMIGALYLGSRRGQIMALILIFTAATSAWPVAELVENA